MCRTEGAVNSYPELFASASDKTPMRKNKYLSMGSGPGSHSLKPLALVIQDFASLGIMIDSNPPQGEHLIIPIIAAEIRLTSI
jgi:hypothetical protein